MIWAYLYKNCSLEEGAPPSASLEVNLVVTRDGKPVSNMTLDGLAMTGAWHDVTAGRMTRLWRAARAVHSLLLPLPWPQHNSPSVHAYVLCRLMCGRRRQAFLF